jgi:hypothetical protein
VNERDHLEDLGADGKEDNMKTCFRTKIGGHWTVFFWVRTGTSVGLLLTW